MTTLGSVLTIVLCMMGIIALVLSAMNQKTPHAERNYNVTKFEKVDDEWQAELADGATYRTGSVGIVWYRYPDGARCELDLEDTLEEQFKAYKLRVKWGVEAPEQEDRDGPRVH
jgi:hypothetical protein